MNLILTFIYYHEPICSIIGPVMSVKYNQSPKGMKWSAVPLPCPTVFSYCFFLVILMEAGQRPWQGTKSCRMGRFSVRPSCDQSEGSDCWSKGSPEDWRGQSQRSLMTSRRGQKASQRVQGLSKGSEGQLERSDDQPEGSEPDGSPGRVRGPAE